jgi:hypothetical protein
VRQLHLPLTQVEPGPQSAVSGDALCLLVRIAGDTMHVRAVGEMVDDVAADLLRFDTAGRPARGEIVITR